MEKMKGFLNLFPLFMIGHLNNRYDVYVKEFFVFNIMNIKKIYV